MDRGNGKEGILGRQVIYCYCAWSMGFQSGIHERAPTRGRPYWAHVGLPKKCREDALITTMRCRWRISPLDHGHITANFDSTDAFGCADRSKLEGSRGQSQEKNIPFA
eukprot:6654815-Pyramimonas_sp.AAC.1